MTRGYAGAARSRKAGRLRGEDWPALATHLLSAMTRSFDAGDLVGTPQAVFSANWWDPAQRTLFLAELGLIHEASIARTFHTGATIHVAVSGSRTLRMLTTAESVDGGAMHGASSEYPPRNAAGQDVNILPGRLAVRINGGEWRYSVPWDNMSGAVISEDLDPDVTSAVEIVITHLPTWSDPGFPKVERFRELEEVQAGRTSFVSYCQVKGFMTEASGTMENTSLSSNTLRVHLAGDSNFDGIDDGDDGIAKRVPVMFLGKPKLTGVGGPLWSWGWRIAEQRAAELGKRPVVANFSYGGSYLGDIDPVAVAAAEAAGTIVAPLSGEPGFIQDNQTSGREWRVTNTRRCYDNWNPHLYIQQKGINDRSLAANYAAAGLTSVYNVGDLLEAQALLVMTLAIQRNLTVAFGQPAASVLCVGDQQEDEGAIDPKARILAAAATLETSHPTRVRSADSVSLVPSIRGKLHLRREQHQQLADALMPKVREITS